MGAIDWNVRSFHGYTTSRGSTYGAYLILDEKITLIDTVKAPFAQELLDRISEIIDPASIEYVISNHVEMDHSGSIPIVMQHMPKAKIITSAPQGLNGLKAHYGEGLPYEGVKAGDTLSIGKRTLQFVPTPMLHWPDNMVTYCPEEKILFSNDGFGQHFASDKHFDDECDLDEVYQEAQKYYANILMCYGSQAKKALDVVKTLPLEYICPSHGVVWRSHIADIMKRYQQWSAGEQDGSAVIVFDSMWHSTERLAVAVSEAFALAGVTTHVFDLKETHISDIMTKVLPASYIAVGSPTLNNNMLPNVAAFLTYLKGLTTRDKIGLAFGSYGWGGQSIAQVQEALAACGYQMPWEPFRFLYIPKTEEEHAMQIAIQEKVRQLSGN